MPKGQQEIFLVIPAYNEAVVVRKVVQELLAFYPNVIVVDDGSSDDTYSEILASGAKVLRHIINLGQGAALQTGIENNGTYVSANQRKLLRQEVRINIRYFHILRNNLTPDTL